MGVLGVADNGEGGRVCVGEGVCVGWWAEPVFKNYIEFTKITIQN